MTAGSCQWRQSQRSGWTLHCRPPSGRSCTRSTTSTRRTRTGHPRGRRVGSWDSARRWERSQRAATATRSLAKFRRDTSYWRALSWVPLLLLHPVEMVSNHWKLSLNLTQQTTLLCSTPSRNPMRVVLWVTIWMWTTTEEAPVFIITVDCSLFINIAGLLRTGVY